MPKTKPIPCALCGTRSPGMSCGNCKKLSTAEKRLLFSLAQALNDFANEARAERSRIAFVTSGGKLTLRRVPAEFIANPDDYEAADALQWPVIAIIDRRIIATSTA